MLEIGQTQGGYRRKKNTSMASPEENYEKETRLTLDVYVCKASREELLLFADKLQIPEEDLAVPEFKLKVVVLS